MPLLFTGCSSKSIPAGAAVPMTAHMTGKIHGGEQPVVGAMIQLYDATTGGTPLISSPPLSDANGNFTITGLWSGCSPSDQLYLVAYGGNPGSGLNSDLILMSAVGACQDLTPSSFVSINEVTTVATIVAFLGDFSASNATTGTTGAYIAAGSAGEYTSFLGLVDPVAGVALSSNGDQSMLNALANSITACVNATSDINGDNSVCDNIITASNLSPVAGAPQQDSAVAIYSVITNPTAGVGYVFGLAPSNPSFLPTFSSAPASWIF
jgi:hypothetical protein